jgi:hypothetical protein
MEILNTLRAVHFSPQPCFQDRIIFEDLITRGKSSAKDHALPTSSLRVKACLGCIRIAAWRSIPETTLNTFVKNQRCGDPETPSDPKRISPPCHGSGSDYSPLQLPE